VLYNFGSKSGDPTNPGLSGVISQSRGGNMFSSAGNFWTNQAGAAFRVTPGGTLTVVHRFTAPGATGPWGGLTLATDGQYYGTNKDGGQYGYGNIFRMKQGGGLTVLHAFNAADHGAGCSHPYAPPIESVAGDLYGTATGDGSFQGCVYRISKSGQFKVLHSFDYWSGAGPFGPLVQGSDFYFYGTTNYGGAHEHGTIFRISSTGAYKVLFEFDGARGASPEGRMIEGSDGNFYGTTIGGGTDYGVVFKITPEGVVTVLYAFSGGNDGGNPVGGLVQASDGNFYGTAYGGANGEGVLYRVSAAGDFAVLHTFDWSDGGFPENTLMQHTNGQVYGTTFEGGSAGNGTFFSLDVGLAPFVTYLPTYGRAGALVQILGQGFTSGSRVSFNGTPAASSVVVYPTYLRVIVPSGATTGPITVTTDTGTLTSNKVFVVH
jgi:uncharacterized repeat protein (TIGR03803 family)